MTRDLRRYARQTNTRLVVGFILILFLLGDGLIYFFYGQSAAISGLICLAAGLLPLVLIGLVLYGMEWVVKRAEDE